MAVIPGNCAKDNIKTYWGEVHNLGKLKEECKEEGEVAGLGDHPVAETLRTPAEQRGSSQRWPWGSEHYL